MNVAGSNPDGKGGPLVKEHAAKVPAFETAKENPGNRRMATVASVYTVDPHIRTAEKITKALFRDEADLDASKPSRPEPANKITTAHTPEMVDDGDGIDFYLEKHSHRMRYDECLRRGYPIASGVMEGVCRHLVKDRMERSGMRWTLEGARSMLHVRAVFQSDHWESFLANRMSGGAERTHPHRNLLNAYRPMALAC